ncbi:BTB/POZ domain-containing protein 9-like [Adelges cooleyi]|uniref:BTB/POZ domain-containing protein 9-like n=1 Tax=Adelges cooleyi TaxID=133065 RepID=UPI00217FE333|nr:BTB/POZ domain-containing protein 9-like [Adelges cooleyi]
MIHVRQICSDPVNYSLPAPTTEQHNNKLIDHAQEVVTDISRLYLKDSFSDVVLLVDQERLSAHRIVLASRSDYFRNFLYGGLQESDKREVEIHGVSITSFKIILKYIYTGRMNLDVLEDKEVLELFRLSDYFLFTNLKHSLYNHLRRNVNANNACLFFAMARIKSYKELEVESLNFIRKHAIDVLESKDFLSLSADAIQEILNSKSVLANEIDVFRAVRRWINQNQQDNLDPRDKIKVLSVVTYPLMNAEELAEVKESELVSSDTISGALRIINTWPPHKLQYRGLLKPNENLARQSDISRVTHSITRGSILKLDHPSIVNYIEILLCNGDLRPYSYYIQVSMDEQNWIRVIDHSNCDCRSVQRLWFHSRLVRYINIVGTNSTADASFEVWTIYYNTNDMHLVEIQNGLIVPKCNVATRTHNAYVIKGEYSSTRQSLLENNYEDSFIYTYHQLRSGSIVVRFDQPFILSSMRMLLWGGYKYYYSYIIESSVNNVDWEIVINKSQKLARSWQVLQFEPRPVVFIRITGVYSSDGDEFRCVYLEAPSQVPLDSNIVEDDRVENNETDIAMVEAPAQAPID